MEGAIPCAKAGGCPLYGQSSVGGGNSVARSKRGQTRLLLTKKCSLAVIQRSTVDVFSKTDECRRSDLSPIERGCELLTRWDFAHRRSPADRRLVGNFCDRYTRQLVARGRTVEGAPYASLSLEILEQLAKPTKADQLELAQRLNDLGAIYRVAGDPMRTVVCQIRALAIRELWLPKDSPLLAKSWHDLAYSVRSVLGQPAVSMFLEAKRIGRDAHGSSSVPVALVDSNLGISLSSLGQNYWAHRMTDSAWQVTKSRISDDHPHTATVALSFSRQLIGQKEFHVAEGFLEEATKVRQHWYGQEAWETWDAIEAGVSSAMEKGDYDRAYRKLKGENLEDWIWGGDPIQGRMLQRYIDCCRKTGRQQDRQQAEVLQRSVTGLFGREKSRKIPYAIVLRGAKPWLPMENREKILGKIWNMAQRDAAMETRGWSREELLMN